MCTIAILWGQLTDVPLAIAANRDELYERPARAPFVFGPGRVGGRDDVLGGSWLAFTRDGRFAAVTNQRELPRVTAPRSRGELVLGLLDAGDRAAMRAYADAIDPTQYASANLVFGDASGADLVYLRRAGTRERLAVAPGLTILGNDRLDAPDQPKQDRLRALLAPATTWAELVALAPGALGDHALPGLQALCIHTPRYGTRSSTLAALAPGAVRTLAWADGAPCVTRFVDATALLGVP